MPSLLMPLVSPRRKELIEDRRQVLLQARLELDRPDGPGAADIENLHSAGSDMRPWE
jgi:hypothetical protein